MAKNGHNGVTLETVAEQAGVSMMTVSRVINGSSAVAVDTRRMVEEIISQTGYEAPPVEKRFRSAIRRQQKIKTGNIALLFPDPRAEAMRTALSAEIAQGVEDELHRNNLNLFVTHLRGPEELPRCIEEKQVDGVLIRTGDLTKSLQEVLRPFPCVSVLGPIPGGFADVVQPDDEAIGRVAAETLLARGHRRMLCLNFDDRHGAHLVRRDGFVRTVRLTDAECEVLACARQEGAELLERFAARAGDVDAVFVPGFTQEAGEGVVEERLIDLGFDKQKGRDAILELYANREMTPRAAYRLIGIDPCNEEVARRAVKQLMNRIRHPKDPVCRVLVEPRVVGE
jgi:DNA-binding LacI/PurR family transcriptional regulator